MDLMNRCIGSMDARLAFKFISCALFVFFVFFVVDHLVMCLVVSPRPNPSG
jgi:hypothetical protein